MALNKNVRYCTKTVKIFLPHFTIWWQIVIINMRWPIYTTRATETNNTIVHATERERQSGRPSNDRNHFVKTATITRPTDLIFCNPKHITFEIKKVNVNLARQLYELELWAIKEIIVLINRE